MTSTIYAEHEELFPFIHHRYPRWRDELWHDETCHEIDLQLKVNDGEIEVCEEDAESDLHGHDPEESQESWQVLPSVVEDKAETASLDTDSSAPAFKVLHGSQINDVPAVYEVPTLQSYEFPAVGVWIDRRIVPGFKYRVRPIDREEYEEYFLFDGKGLVLQSIGYGYARRITFMPPSGQLNSNGNYFYSDSRLYGFAFQPELVSVGENYTIYDVSNHPLGHLEIIKLLYPQEELRHTVLDDQSVEKMARVRLLAKVLWFNNNEVCVVSVTGDAFSIKKNFLAQVSRIIGVTISGNSCRNYTLYPGIDDKNRCVIVNGANYGDVPITYSVVGLETYELPVIGTYVDPRILPGFYYKVRPINCKQYLFDGRAVRLTNIGTGYSKRLTFAPDKNCMNANSNYFWTDSYPNGFGFELRAVHCGSKFTILAENRPVGHVSVFRVDYPQYEENQTIEKYNHGITITKYVHVEVICLVTIYLTESDQGNSKICEDRVMRISGRAVLQKRSCDSEVKIMRIEDIGLDSQLSISFFAEHTNLIFRAE